MFSIRSSELLTLVLAPYSDISRNYSINYLIDWYIFKGIIFKRLITFNLVAYLTQSINSNDTSQNVRSRCVVNTNKLTSTYPNRF